MFGMLFVGIVILLLGLALCVLSLALIVKFAKDRNGLAAGASAFLTFLSVIVFGIGLAWIASAFGWHGMMWEYMYPSPYYQPYWPSWHMHP